MHIFGWRNYLQALLTAISEKLGREVTVSVNKAAIVTTDVDLSTATVMQGEFNIEEDCGFLYLVSLCSIPSFIYFRAAYVLFQELEVFSCICWIGIFLASPLQRNPMTFMSSLKKTMLGWWLVRNQVRSTISCSFTKIFMEQNYLFSNHL